MKKLVCAALMCAAAATAVHAEQPITILYNDAKLTPEQPPVIVDGRTLVPVRTVCDALGLDIDWDGERQIVRICDETNIVSMQIGSSLLGVNESTTVLDAAPEIINDYTCVPLRAVIEPFGAEVGWDAKTKTVTITDAAKKTDSEDIADKPAAGTKNDSVKPGSGSNNAGNTGKPATNKKNDIEKPAADEKNDSCNSEETDKKPTVEKKFAFYSQGEEQWGFESNGKGYCWVCSYAMMITNLTGERITPIEVAEFNLSAGGSSGNYMMSHSGLAAKYGLKFVAALDESSLYFASFETDRRGATYINAETEDDVRAALAETLGRNPRGVMVRFEGYPHTLVATRAADGKIYFNDPAGAEMEDVEFSGTCLARRFSITDISYIQALAAV